MATDKNTKIDKESTNYPEGTKQLLKNVAAAGVGTAFGYYGGGMLGKALLASPRVKKYLGTKSPDEIRSIANKIRYGGAMAGTLAGALTSNELQKALNKPKKDANEKTAEFFISYAYRRLV